MTVGKVRSAFDRYVIMLPIDYIIPQREVSPLVRRSSVYKQIAASIEHIGLIEPIAVYPNAPNEYLLLDGHLRLDILKHANVTEIRAILSIDDEAYTYNKRVNHAPPIAQHFMILKAIANGVDEQSIAAALNLDVASIRRKRDMLEGICPEAVEVLRNTHVPADTFAVLKKMRAVRQIEAAEHMIAAKTYSARFAKSLLAVTRPELLAGGQPSTDKDQPNQAAVAMLEEESESLVRDLKAVETSYGTDMLSLTVFCGYAERLLNNSRIEKYLMKNHAAILGTLRSLLDEAKPAGSVRTKENLSIRTSA